MPIDAYMNSLQKILKDGPKKFINLEIMIFVPNISDTLCHVPLRTFRFRCTHIIYQIVHVSCSLNTSDFTRTIKTIVKTIQNEKQSFGLRVFCRLARLRVEITDIFSSRVHLSPVRRTRITFEEYIGRRK